MTDEKKKRRSASKVERRRKGAPRKTLSPELEALARGDEKALRKKRKERLRDPRPVALIPGVANRDARAVADARVEAMRAMIAWDDQDSLDRAMADLTVLRLWRGLSITGMDALAEDLLELAPEDAKAAAERGAAATDRGLEPLDDVAVAAWLRTEAALLEMEIDAGVKVDAEGRISLSFPAVVAPEAFDAVARRLAPLLEDRRPKRPSRDSDGDRGRDDRRGPPRDGDRRGPPRGGRDDRKGGRDDRKGPPRGKGGYRGKSGPGGRSGGGGKGGYRGKGGKGR
ncbi:MAG: hypothetical protein JJ863_14685 [Deltaproteobacteria bacterium]|nr:hypothetical protein [Deltaproteobacteria bacterium]